MYEIWSVGHKPFENCNNNEVYIHIIAADSYAQPRACILLWRIEHATPIVTVQTSKFFNVTKKDNIAQVRARANTAYRTFSEVVTLKEYIHPWQVVQVPKLSSHKRGQVMHKPGNIILKCQPSIN